MGIKSKIIFEKILWVILIIAVLIVGLLISNEIDNFNLEEKQVNETFVENNMKYKEDIEGKINQLEAEKGPGKFYEKIFEMKLKTIENSGIVVDIILPKYFDDVEIGMLLKERAELSRELGYDFSKYLGREVMILSLRVDTGSDKIQEVIGIVYNDEMVGFWITPIFNNILDGDISLIMKTFLGN